MVARRVLPAGGPPALPRAGNFQLAVERHETSLVLRVEGEFDLNSIGQVEAAIDHPLRELAEHLVFDLRGVTFLDMAALMTLMRANARARSSGFDVQVVAPTGPASRVFTMTRAGAELTFVDDVPAGAPLHDA